MKEDIDFDLICFDLIYDKLIRIVYVSVSENFEIYVLLCSSGTLSDC